MYCANMKVGSPIRQALLYFGIKCKDDKRK